MSDTIEQAAIQTQIDAEIGASRLKPLIIGVVLAYVLSWLPVLGRFVFWASVAGTLTLAGLTIRWWMRYRHFHIRNQHSVRLFPTLASVVLTLLTFAVVLGSTGILPTAPFVLPAVERSRQRADTAQRLAEIMSKDDDRPTPLWHRQATANRRARTIVVVRDEDGVYRAFKLFAVNRLDQTTITLAERTVLLTIMPSRPGTLEEVEYCVIRKYDWRWAYTRYQCDFGDAQADLLTATTPITAQEFVAAVER